MIIALEGPDGSGKTTLWQSLRTAFGFAHPELVFANFPSMGKDLWPFAEHVEYRDRHLFESVYDEKRTYVTDRFFAVTGPVYGRVFNRHTPDYRTWYPRLQVIYLAAHPEQLVERLNKRQETPQIRDHFHRIIEAYRETLMLGDYEVHVVPSTTIEQTQEKVERCIRRLVSS